MIELSINFAAVLGVFSTVTSVTGCQWSTKAFAANVYGRLWPGVDVHLNLQGGRKK